MPQTKQLSSASGIKKAATLLVSVDQEVASAIMGELDKDTLESVTAEIAKLGPQVAVVVGAGNILRGETFSKESHIPRNTADYMGMLATIINACTLQETLEKLGQPTRVMSAIEVAAMCEPFLRHKALRHLERGRITILACLLFLIVTL